MGCRAQAQVAPRDFQALSLDISHFLDQFGGVDERAVANYVDSMGVRDARGYQMQGQLASVWQYDRVAGVVATVEARHNFIIFGQHVNKTTFAFVATLQSNYYIYCHFQG